MAYQQQIDTESAAPVALVAGIDPSSITFDAAPANDAAPEPDGGAPDVAEQRGKGAGCSPRPFAPLGRA